MTRLSSKMLMIAAPALLMAAPLFGQAAISSLKGHDSNAPVDVAADRIELQDRADRALLTGNVEVRQGDMTLRAARLTVAYTRNASTEIKRLDASGNVTLTSPSETASGDVGIYDLDRRLITMMGHVTLTHGASDLHGGRLVIDLDSGRATMDGAVVNGGSNRVTGRFTVPKRDR